MAKLTPYWQLAAEDVFPGEAAFERLLKRKRIHVYFGVDVTGPVVHIGHAVGLRLLASLQEQGHTVTFLFGGFTTLVGDPSGRDKGRPVLDEADIAANVATYKEQLFKILDPKLTKFADNTEWYTNPRTMGTLREFLRLGVHFTAAQLWERDMFQQRQQKGQPVTLTEFIYPVLQAYDFVELEADLQIGATDQTFNVLAGRELSKKMGKGEKFVLTTKILRGTDGRKMSKSYDNYIGVLDPPADMYGKLMSVRDELLPEYFALAVGVDPNEPTLKELILTDPRAAKAKMALEVTTFYHGAQAGELAAGQFTAQFGEGKLPTDILEVTPSVTGEAKLAFFLVDLGLASSRSDAARLIEQGGVRVDEATITDPHAVIAPHDGMILNVGKRKFRRIKL